MQLCLHTRQYTVADCLIENGAKIEYINQFGKSLHQFFTETNDDDAVAFIKKNMPVQKEEARTASNLIVSIIDESKDRN